MSNLVGKIIAYEDGDLTDREVLELFSELVKTRQAYSLQGHYGRLALALIDGGYLETDGTITELGEVV